MASQQMSFTFHPTEANDDGIELPLHLLVSFCNRFVCSYVRCLIAYPKAVYTDVGVFPRASLINKLLTPSISRIYVNFHYDLNISSTIILKLKALDASLVEIQDAIWVRKGHVSVEALLCVLSTSPELNKLIKTRTNTRPLSSCQSSSRKRKQ